MELLNKFKGNVIEVNSLEQKTQDSQHPTLEKLYKENETMASL